MREPKVYTRLVEVVDELTSFMDAAAKELPAERYRVLESTGLKLVTTLDRAGEQLRYLIAQRERLRPKPPSPPAKPGTLHRLKPRSKPRRLH